MKDIRYWIGKVLTPEQSEVQKKPEPKHSVTEKMKFLKYFTPFAYAEGADILTAGKLDGKLVAIGMVITAAGIAAAFWQYGRKDIHG